MIIVIGSIIVNEGHVDEALEISQRHVDRSRKEPGCITHGVHLDSENPQRLVFVEQWSDQSALSQHFKEPTSIEFLRKLETMATEAPEMSVYDATQLNPPSKPDSIY